MYCHIGILLTTKYSSFTRCGLLHRPYWNTLLNNSDDKSVDLVNICQAWCVLSFLFLFRRRTSKFAGVKSLRLGLNMACYTRSINEVMYRAAHRNRRKTCPNYITALCKHDHSDYTVVMDTPTHWSATRPFYVIFPKIYPDSRVLPKVIPHPNLALCHGIGVPWLGHMARMNVAYRGTHEKEIDKTGKILPYELSGYGCPYLILQSIAYHQFMENFNTLKIFRNMFL